MALCSRLTTARSTRAGSTANGGICGSASSTSDWCLRSAWGFKRCTASSSSAVMSVSRRARGSSPDSMRDSSSSSSTSWMSRSTSPSARLRKSRETTGSAAAPSASVSITALMAASGVRSSCETLATKSRRNQLRAAYVGKVVEHGEDGPVAATADRRGHDLQVLTARPFDQTDLTLAAVATSPEGSEDGLVRRHPGEGVADNARRRTLEQRSRRCWRTTPCRRCPAPGPRRCCCSWRRRGGSAALLRRSCVAARFRPSG